MKRPDTKKALSIIEAAEQDMEFTQQLQPTPQAGTTILRNIYECFRMLGEALLIAKGTPSTDHVQPIRELLTLNVQTKRPLRAIENLRTTRHNINYRGYQPTDAEIRDAKHFADACFTQATHAAKNIIQPNT